MLNYNAQAAGETSDTIITRLLNDIRSGREPPMPPSRAYSDPDAIAQIADLQLRSRRLAEGAISGQHRSPFHGANVEFAAYREYTPGDDLRRLDWRVFAARIATTSSSTRRKATSA